MYQVVVVDDDPAQLSYISQAVQMILAEHTCSVHCFSGVAQLEFAEEIIPQIAVLDIDLGNGDSGIGVARDLLKRSPSCQIIFLTSHADFVSEVYAVPHLYLALKSTTMQYLPVALKMAIATLESTEEEVFWLWHKGPKELKKRLLQRDVLMFERSRRITLVHTAQEVLCTSMSIDSISKQVAMNRFVRCHQSFLVNLDCVVQHAMEEFTLADGTRVPISRRYQKKMRDMFLAYIEQCVQI